MLVHKSNNKTGNLRILEFKNYREKHNCDVNQDHTLIGHVSVEFFFFPLQFWIVSILK